MAPGKDERDLVGQHQLRARDLQVPCAYREVLRLGRSAQHVDDLEALAQLHQVAEILERAGTAAALAVHDVRRSRGRRKRHVAVVQRHMPLRIDRVQRDLARCARQRCRDEGAVDAHDLARLIDARAGFPVHPACIGGQHLHALGLEHDERRFVHRRDLVVRKHPHRRERIAQMAVGPRAIEYGMRLLAGPRAAAAAAGGFDRFSHGSCSGILASMS